MLDVVHIDILLAVEVILKAQVEKEKLQNVKNLLTVKQ